MREGPRRRQSLRNRRVRPRTRRRRIRRRQLPPPLLHRLPNRHPIRRSDSLVKMEKDANHGVLFSRIRGLVVIVLVRLALTLHLFMLLFFFFKDRGRAQTSLGR